MAVSHERIRELVLGAAPSDEEIVDMAHELRELRRVYRAARQFRAGRDVFGLDAALDMAGDFTLPVTS